MVRTQRILMFSLCGFAAVAMAMLAGSAMYRRNAQLQREVGQPSAENLAPPYTAVPDFSLVDQDGKPFQLKDLKGQVWLADFIFTRCTGPCPVMTGHMAEVQRAIGNAPVKLVSFSVDPEYDTPTVLKIYAQRFNANQSRWIMATGDRAAIDAVAKGMSIAVDRGSGPMMHGTYFVLVDRDGNIRGYFGGQDDEGWKRAAAAAVHLASQ